ncbi:RHS repeat-associated core domain-containing protein [Salmonella enterica]|uniref:RHS repeat-associated core domain-containing protein n=1 Tax=Salmonella enterica TaxID=28901 RepID=UPI0003BD605C|nr:RHS repeat-associated core domain-containing protein [Salmonella enterica]EJW1071948.1 RHS repeat protein [Salmonella enterica]ESJ14352.1 RHS repeat-associated core domain-containing protein [Salmonella enterica subsp. diarizonae serovar 60:r:e,n,x,z15 str. 01-0170]
MSTSLFSNTPTVTVLDNRGLTVRDNAYYRHPDSPDVTSERITRHQYDARGFLTQSADPRLNEAGLVNFSFLTDLAGNVLRTHGVDNGITVALNDAAGRPFMTVSNIGTADDGTEDASQAMTRTWQYEGVSLPGRPVGITEQVSGEAARITERFVWAGNSPEEKALNLAGQCVSHYDTAGLMQTDSVALTGVPLSVTRRLLKDADNPDIVADWQGTDASVRNTLPGDGGVTTLTTTDATGAVLTTTDAQGNRQRVAYDVAGLLSGRWLTLKDGTEQVIVKSLTYSAAGQKLRGEHGNGVVTTYEYEPQTQRLVGIKTERPAGHAAGAKVLQDLRYEYDPVGNVLKISNDAEETRFWRNQKVVPENRYTCDSLYRLVSATGREMANAGRQGCNLPSATIPLPADSSAYTNYTRTYTYDSAGNLTQISHSAPATGNNYTTDITVSDRSNRGVLSTLTENPSGVDALFTAGGQQKQLQPGQNLVWTPRNELLKVTPVVRDGSTDDRESYRYDGGSQRCLKVSVQNTGSSTQTQRTLYLPGLELRTTVSGGKETESLEVITVGEAGCAQVRVLHWTAGRPAELTGDQTRYSYDNLTGSSGLELGGDGNIISMEEYYPYGGPAVLTARSQTGADYKTVRYSGKERDATGLYYYGYRYYQPWAGRWLGADPAGTADGLNLFRMVRNNPVSMKDNDGRVTEWLDLAYPHKSFNVVALMYKNNPMLKLYHRIFTQETKKILDEAEINESSLKKLKPNKRQKTSRDMKYTKTKLKNYAAHAGFLNVPSGSGETPRFKSGFVNLPGSLSNKNTFPGVRLIDEKIKRRFKDYSPEKLKESTKWRPETSLGYYRVENVDIFISEIKKLYAASGSELHEVVERRIRNHLASNNNILPRMAGIAGLHAEVQALNHIISMTDTEASVASKLSSSYIYTQRLVGARNEDFPACHNCSGIINGLENIMTGRVEGHTRLIRRKSI